MTKTIKKKQERKQERKPIETIKVSSDADGVACDGGGGSLGHPQVWYDFDRLDEACCHYCGRKFVKQTKNKA